jgi:O-antigen/teichoic acid export membrane protein
LLGFAICLFADEVLRILAASPFWAAGVLIPIFILNSLLMAWGSYARFGLFLQKNTSQLAKATWLSIPVTTVAFVLLIPAFGAVGAALSVVAGNIFRVAYVQRAASRAFDMHLQWGRVLTVLGVFTLIVIGLRFLSLSMEVQILLDAALLGAAIWWVWAGPLLEPEDRQSIIDTAGSVLGRFRRAKIARE